MLTENWKIEFQVQFSETNETKLASCESFGNNKYFDDYLQISNKEPPPFSKLLKFISQKGNQILNQSVSKTLTI